MRPVVVAVLSLCLALTGCSNAYSIVSPGSGTSTIGIISTVAGNGISGDEGDGGRATSAEMASVNGVAMDGAGNLYIADSINSRIRKVTSAGIISTVAGNGISGYSGDGGPATSAEIYAPLGVATDNNGNLYIADAFNARVRKVTAAGIISTVAGTGTRGYSGDGGPATGAQMQEPSAVAVDNSGNLYIADGLSECIRKVTVATGIISTVAGTGIQGFSGDGGPATNAELGSPAGVAVDSNGNLYIADLRNNRVRKVTTAGIISTIAGTGPPTTYNNPFGTYGGDGGAATSAELNLPSGIAVDLSGNLYIADGFNHRVRKVTATGIISTIAGDGPTGTSSHPFGSFGGDGGPATNAELNEPTSVALDSIGNLYIADDANLRARKVTY